MEQRRGGPRKTGGFGGNSTGSRGPRREGASSGGYDRKPREGGSSSGGYERKPRAEGERSYRPRAEGASTGDRPYRARSSEGGSSSYGEKRPYQRREGGSSGGYDRKPREGGSSSGGYERKPRAEGERSYRPRAEGSSFGEKRPYQRREGGSSGGYERKQREGGYDRKPREFSDRPAREPRREYGDKPAYRPRNEEAGSFDRPQRGDGKNARFDGKREVKRDRFSKGEDKQFQQDGWLVGYHAVVAALSAGRRKVRQVWLLAEPKGELQTLLAANPEWPVETKAKPDFEREFGDAVHQGVACLVGNLPQPSLPEFLAGKPQLVVALDQVTDPHNLGAIVRSCAAFGAKGVLVTEHRAAGLSATAAKAAAGAMETVPVVEIVNLVQSLEMMKEAGFTVIGLAGEATESIKDIKVDGPICLVVGSEGEGLRRLTREHSDKLVKIDIAPTIESLNVSVATGVALALLTSK